MDRVYCQPCWLFSHKNIFPGTSYAFKTLRVQHGLNDWSHLLQRIQSHKSSTHHAEACVIYEQWRSRKTIKEALHESLLEKIHFWQNVLKRLVNVTLMLAKCNLPFCRSSEKLYVKIDYHDDGTPPH